MPSVEAIENCLAQTQCGECGYEGCRPYAEALARGAAAINRCRPGGERVIRLLAEILDISSLRPAKPQEAPLTAVIAEEPCIGCTLCIQACPTDCIEGSPRVPHKVGEKNCTGCRLCLEACPVDCITMGPNPCFSHVTTLPTPEKEDWERARAAEVRELCEKRLAARGPVRRRFKKSEKEKVRVEMTPAQRLETSLSAAQLARIREARARARSRASAKILAARAQKSDDGDRKKTAQKGDAPHD